MTLQVITEKDHNPTITKNATLIVSTPCIGNVSQLAMDIIIETSSAIRIAHLHSKKLIPFVGVHPYTHISGVAFALELYHIPNTAIFLIQQRSPAAPGLQKEYADQLADSINSFEFSSVLVLSSLDGSFRRDAQLTGSQLRYWVPQPQSSENTIQSRIIAECEDVLALENEFLDGISIQEKVLPPWTILHSLSRYSSDISVAALLMFVLEGNNFSEAMNLIDCTAKIVPELRRAGVGEDLSSWNM